MYARKGRAHICASRPHNHSWPKISDMYVKVSIVIICPTCEGITKRFVLNVPNPSCFNDRVRYCVGVAECGRLVKVSTQCMKETHSSEFGS